MRNDYQIGDWLYDVSGVPKQVQEVYDDSVTLGGVLCHLSTVKPIPLTKEILEKSRIRYQYGCPWFQYITYDDDDTFEVHFNEYSQLELRYVHQLQHGLKLCGIDKEVIV